MSANELVEDYKASVQQFKEMEETCYQKLIATGKALAPFLPFFIIYCRVRANAAPQAEMDEPAGDDRPVNSRIASVFFTREEAETYRHDLWDILEKRLGEHHGVDLQIRVLKKLDGAHSYQITKINASLEAGYRQCWMCIPKYMVNLE